MAQLNIIEQAFNRVHDIADKVQALLLEAKNNNALHERILVILAKFLNTADSKILGEAYERLSILGERLRTFALHVEETKLGRCPCEEGRCFRAGCFAYVYQKIPPPVSWSCYPISSRIKRLSIIHEISHQATGSFVYISDIPKNIRRSLHHVSFGTYPFEPDSAHVPLGRAGQSYGTTGVERLKPVSGTIAPAQARVRFLPMERANAKMGNADSQVILFLALFNNFEFEKVPVAGTDTYLWRIKPVEDALAQAKRDVLAQSDLQDGDYCRAGNPDLIAAGRAGRTGVQ